MATARTHGDPLARRVVRGVARAFQPADDVFAAVESGAVLQQPIITGRRIVVGGPRGGGGKSTLTALLAMVFAHYRYDRVLAVDIAPGAGALAPRLGVRPRLSLADLTDSATEPGSFDQLEPYLTGARERLWMLPGHRGDAVGGDLRARTYPSTVLPLTRFFGVTLVDCGADMSDELNLAALAGAHAHVLVEEATRDGAASIGRVLDRTVADGDRDRLRRTVIVFAERAPRADPAFDFAGSADVLRGSGAEVVRLGYDRHVARTTALDPRRFARATNTAVTRIAAEALNRSL